MYWKGSREKRETGRAFLAWLQARISIYEKESLFDSISLPSYLLSLLQIQFFKGRTNTNPACLPSNIQNSCLAAFFWLAGWLGKWLMTMKKVLHLWKGKDAGANLCLLWIMPWPCYIHLLTLFTEVICYVMHVYRRQVGLCIAHGLKSCRETTRERDHKQESNQFIPSDFDSRHPSTVLLPTFSPL
jgi:hypothetical protein